MSIAFIIPLKSKRVSKNWEVTSNLLKQTLRSLDNQTCNKFYVAIVGHERPLIEDAESINISFSESPFELVLKNGKKNIETYTDINYILDKLQKTAIGLKVLSIYNPDYYMVLDADDLLHETFVQYVLKNKNPNGYIVKKGYAYYPLQNMVIKEPALHKICGSTTVVHQKHVIIPDKTEMYGFKPILWNKISHEEMETYFEKKGLSLQEIPFSSVMYSLNHGQNASEEFRLTLMKRLKQQAKILLKGRMISKQLKKEFALPDE